jgi:hypothetical protein
MSLFMRSNYPGGFGFFCTTEDGFIRILIDLESAADLDDVIHALDSQLDLHIDPFAEYRRPSNQVPEVPSLTRSDASVTSPRDGKDYVNRLARNPGIARLVAVGIIIVALAAFTDALQKIIAAIVSLWQAIF